MADIDGVSAAGMAPVAFIGGGNMATALAGGLLRQGMPPHRIHIVEPMDHARARLHGQLGIIATPAADERLRGCRTVVWAVKPQDFRKAAVGVSALGLQALHLSVAAGIRTESIETWVGSPRIVRAMPNTPALIGMGMTGLYGAPAVTSDERAHVDLLLSSTGELLWLEREDLLDAVTAISGSGPAYVFYLLEAFKRAGVDMGLGAAQARRLGLAIFAGASAQQGTESGELNGVLDDEALRAAFVRAMHAAHRRAGELGNEFGAPNR